MTRVDDRGPAIRLDPDAIDGEGVVAAFLFGSQATGREGALSDVDVAVWLDPALDASERLALRLRLAAAAGRAIGSDEVHVAVLNDASPLLRHRARRSAVPLVERDAKTRVRLESRALVEYLDTKPLREELARGLRHRLAEDRFGRR